MHKLMLILAVVFGAVFAPSAALAHSAPADAAQVSPAISTRAYDRMVVDLLASGYAKTDISSVEAGHAATDPLVTVEVWTLGNKAQPTRQVLMTPDGFIVQVVNNDLRCTIPDAFTRDVSGAEEVFRVGIMSSSDRPIPGRIGIETRVLGIQVNFTCYL